MALSCSNKIVCSIKMNNVKPSLWFLFCEFLFCLQSSTTENNFQSHEKVWNNEDPSGIVLPTQKNITLEFNQYMKSDQMSYNSYTDIGSLFSKIDNCNKKSRKIFNNKSKKTYSLQIFNVICLGI